MTDKDAHHPDTKAELLRMQSDLMEIKGLLQQYRVIMFGDQSTSGIITRVRDLEKGLTEVGGDYSKGIQALQFALDKIMAALVGDVSDGVSKPGLIAIVEKDREKIADIFKFLWIVIGAATALVIAQVWQAVLAYQALSLVQK